MADTIDVGMGNMKIASSPTKLAALGVGSCIVVTLYDPVLKTGALAHTMLPDSTKGAQTKNPFKYADLAVTEMIKQLEKGGSRKLDLEVKLAGGANMFPHLTKSSLTETGNANVMAVKTKLKAEGLRITGEALGGSFGRSVELNTITGIVTIRIKI